jgi:hypothetical protein
MGTRDLPNRGGQWEFGHKIGPGSGAIRKVKGDLNWEREGMDRRK